MKFQKDEFIYKKKKTKKGRSELIEIFHKSIIKNILIGLNFIDKAENLQYKGNISNLYLYETVYFFIEAKKEMEYMELLDSEKGINHQKFIVELGENTINTTCKVFMDGLNKLYNNLPNGIEKETINTIRQAIKPYI